MPPEIPAIDWIELLERFGVPTALVAFGCFCIYKVGQFFAPIIRNYIERKIAAQEKHAEASLISAKAASSNADSLAKTAERTIEIQKDAVTLHRENTKSQNRLTTAFEALVTKLDHIAFHPPEK